MQGASEELKGKLTDTSNTNTLKLTASKAPWNFDAWEVGTWNFLFLGSLCLFCGSFQGECLFVTRSKGHPKFEVSAFQVYFLPNNFSNFSFHILNLDEFDDISIYIYISSTSDSEIQVCNFLRGTLLLNQVWESWAGSERRCWLQAQKIHPKIHRSTKNKLRH